MFQVSIAGLAVIYALMLASSMTSLVAMMSDTEKDFIAVERCRELTEEMPLEANVVSCSVVVSKVTSFAGPPHYPALN